jgi:hypothetical protein
MPPECRGASFGDRGDRNPGRVGADDGVGAAVLVDAGEERLFGVEALDDRLENPVGVADAGKVLVERPGADQRGDIRREERIGLHRARAAQTFGGGVARHVEQQHGQAGVGKVRGNLRAHHPGAEHRGRSDLHGRLAFRGAERAAPVARCARRAIRPLVRTSPPAKMSTIASASPASA